MLSIRSLIMTLINFTKEELQKIEYYLQRYTTDNHTKYFGKTDPVVVSILEKIDALSNICECNNQS